MKSLLQFFIKGVNMREKEVYEIPIIEVIEFQLEDNIALSGDFGSSTVCGEGIW